MTKETRKAFALVREYHRERFPAVQSNEFLVKNAPAVLELLDELMYAVDMNDERLAIRTCLKAQSLLKKCLK